MTTILYTVLNGSGSVQARGCTAAEAAQEVMGYDGYEFEIRAAEDGNGFELWTSQFSRNSTAYRGVVKSLIYSGEDDRAKAEAQIYTQVIHHADWWKGCDVMTDADYDAITAEAIRDAE